jgi:hypothetical protein
MDGFVTETFFENCLKLLEKSNTGTHTRELGLELMFHCWYLLEEPPFLTGFDQARENELGLDFAVTFNEVHASFAPKIHQDPEMLYTIAVMGEITPWALGDENVWIERSLEYRNLYELLEPNGLDPKLIENRGEYGKYFAHQLRYARDHPRT